LVCTRKSFIIWKKIKSFFFSRFMRTECINHQYGFDKPMPVTRLMDNVSNSTKQNSVFLFILLIYFRMSSSNSTLWSPSIRCWFSHGWFRCMLISQAGFSSLGFF
jgi:hypothetical protein